nr:MAG TPA: endonuclease-like protein [Caudoviricetes sp.]
MCDSRTQKWIDKVLTKYPHNADLFDYSQVVVVNCKEKVNIICKQCGKVFPQTPDNHLNLGRGCPDCRKAQSKKNSGASRRGKANLNRRSSTEEWLAKVLAKHPEFADKYDYSQAVYTKTDEPVTIICKTCGRICTPQARKHMAGQGCKSCAGRKSNEKNVPIFQEVVERAKAVHGDKYEYFENSYTDMSKPMLIKHKKCGNVFPQRPEFHIGKKQGCPFCQHIVSSGEKDVLAFVKEYTSCEVQNNVRIVPDFFVGSKLIHKAELDIYIPELKLAIEYNGTHFHDISLKGKGYHIGKRKACEGLGVRLISVWECDWQDDRKRPILERYLKNALGVREERTIYARNCVVKDVPQDMYREFMEENHIQGYASAKEAKCGLYTKDTDELVACMSFRILKNKDQKNTPFVMWDMVRYATNCNVPGGRSKLFHHMQQRFHMDHVQSFVDRDYFNGASYLKEGWELVEDDQVSISFWSYRGGRMSRQMWWKKNIPATLEKLGLPADLYDETKTQEWNAYNAGCKILENSGNSRFEWHSEEGKKDPLYLEWIDKHSK